MELVRLKGLGWLFWDRKVEVLTWDECCGQILVFYLQTRWLPDLYSYFVQALHFGRQVAVGSWLISFRKL